MAAQPKIIPLHPTVVDGLALAMASASDAPLLLLDGDLSVVAASESFCRAFDIDLSSVNGRRVAEIGNGEWGDRQVEVLLAATAAGEVSIDAYEMDLVRPGLATRHLVLHARKLSYGDEASVRLVLSVTDVTDTRAGERLKDDLLREKAILMQELQHRIANSLQIISSVLLQSARQSTSEETRGHLTDANNRMMSVAAVQRQLSSSTPGSVKLGPYLEQLCKSISASMIEDPDLVSLTVVADDSIATSDVSISLGLIVTELVINALKHAFPGRRRGAIVVEYRSSWTGWTLTVTDDGVGMPTDPLASKPGLGTSIVEALAKQLQAIVTVKSSSSGTSTSIAQLEALKQETLMPKELIEFAASSNGDRWLYGKGEEGGRDVVEHRANVPSGGAVTRMDVAAFLKTEPAGPEHAALRQLLEPAGEEMPEAASRARLHLQN